jgi:hypothetical protein
VGELEKLVHEHELEHVKVARARLAKVEKQKTGYLCVGKQCSSPFTRAWTLLGFREDSITRQPEAPQRYKPLEATRHLSAHAGGKHKLFLSIP